jgi:hypothetical protein
VPRDRNQLAGPIDDAKAAWDDYVGQLRSREQELNDLEARAQWVKADAYLDDATLADVDRVLADIASTRSKVFTVIDAIRKVGDWWSKPASGAQWQTDAGLAGAGRLGGLGLVWLAPIPLAVIATAIAVIVASLRSGNPVIERAEQVRQTVSAFVRDGMPIDQAVTRANEVVPRAAMSLGDGLSGMGLWIALAIGAFLLMR